MDKATKHKLMAIAAERLRATSNDGWSYLHGEPSIGFFKWDWAEAEGIERGDEVSARKLVERGMQGVGLLVPIEIAGKVEGYALFSVHCENAAEDEPFLEGIFDGPDAAVAHLKLSGVVGSWEN